MEHTIVDCTGLGDTSWVQRELLQFQILGNFIQFFHNRGEIYDEYEKTILV
jgi:hypothetical protein